MKQRGHFEYGDGSRILIVGINYAPEHSGIAPYTTQAAEHFASLGHSVEVLTGVPHYPSWTVPVEYRRHLSVKEVRNGVAVRRLRHYVPRSQSALRRGLYEATFALQVLVRRARFKPDVVVAVVPSLISALPAAAIAKKSGARFVMWIQDSMASAAIQSGIAGGRSIAGIVQMLERRALRQADNVMVITEAFRRHVLDAGVLPERIDVVPNWTHIAPPTESRAVTRERMGWRDEEIIALHAGNMGLKQGLRVVVEAARIAQQQGLPLRFVLLGDGSQRAELEASAAGVTHVEFVAPVPDAEFTNVLAAADWLLITELPGVHDMSLPSKLTSYRATSRPIIASVQANSATAVAVRGAASAWVLQPGDALAIVECMVAGAPAHERPEDAGTSALAAVPEMLERIVVGSSFQA